MMHVAIRDEGIMIQVHDHDDQPCIIVSQVDDGRVLFENRFSWGEYRAFDTLHSTVQGIVAGVRTQVQARQSR